MIKSFNCKETEKLWLEGKSKKFPSDILKRCITKLDFIDVASDVNDLLSPPSNKLKQLIGKRAGQWSIRVNDQYRICFVWIDSNAYNVEIVDYH